MVLKTLELQKLSEGSSLKALGAIQNQIKCFQRQLWVKDFRQTLGFT